MSSLHQQYESNRDKNKNNYYNNNNKKAVEPCSSSGPHNTDLSHRFRNSISELGGANDDSLLVEDLKGLSFAERERLYEEIHGVAEDLPATPESTFRALAALKDELSKIPKADRKAYDRAIFLKPNLEHDDSFFILCLRADYFDAKKAAWRICRFFTHKRELFGDEKIAKNITIDDLNQDDLECMRTAGIYVLNYTDQSGRKILVYDVRHLKFTDWKPMLRHNWYIHMRTALDKESSTRGVVNVILATGKKCSDPNTNYELLRKLHLINDVPLKMAAVHYCFDSPFQRPFIYVFQRVIGTHRRLRFRAHYGTPLECRYMILTYGIQLPDFLMDEGDSIEKERLVEVFIKEQRLKEEDEAAREQMVLASHCGGSRGNHNNNYVLYPNPADVLVGRGRPYQKYSGNVQMAALVHEFGGSYMETSDRLEKTIIGMKILEKIKQSQGRFLERTTFGWRIVEDELSRKKICQAIRMRARNTTTATQNNNSNNDNNVVCDVIGSSSDKLGGDWGNHHKDNDDEAMRRLNGNKRMRLTLKMEDDFSDSP